MNHMTLGICALFCFCFAFNAILYNHVFVPEASVLLLHGKLF